MKSSAYFHFAAAATALALSTGATSAATVSVTGISGIWASATPAAAVSGIGTDTISWGTPAGGSAQSNYNFTAQGTPINLLEGVSALMGQFTHTNFPITGSSLTAAVLDITFDLLIGGTTAASITNSYNFTHWETENAQDPCANGDAQGVGVNSNGCADRVQATLNNATAQTFTVDGVEYTINLDSFGGFGTEGGLPTFWTVEGQSNTADLMMSYSTYIPPAPIPLPATAWMLLAGIGGLAAYRRRQRAV